MYFRVFFNLLSAAIYYIFSFLIYYLGVPENVIWGFIGGYWGGGICMDYYRDSTLLNTISIFILTNIATSIGLFLYYYKQVHIQFINISTLWLLFGVSFSIARTHLMKILDQNHREEFPFYMNFIAAITWVSCGLSLYYRSLILNNMSFFFSLYICLMVITFIGARYTTYNNSLEHPNITYMPWENLWNDSNYLVCIGFMLLAFASALYFNLYLNTLVLIYYQLVGLFISCFLFYFVFPVLGIKQSMLWSLLLAISMFFMSNIYIQNICVGIVSSSIFISYIYAYIYYPRNIGLIFAFFNGVNCAISLAMPMIIRNYGGYSIALGSYTLNGIFVAMISIIFLYMLLILIKYD